jgi:hypothetical protein
MRFGWFTTTLRFVLPKEFKIIEATSKKQIVKIHEKATFYYPDSHFISGHFIGICPYRGNMAL